MDTDTQQKSIAELNLLLSSKTRQTINKFLAIIGVSIFVCVGLLIYLTITSLNRPNDPIYLVNNTALGVLTIVSLVSGLWSWHKLQYNDYHQPLKNWLEARIELLSGWLTGRFNKMYLFLIPLLYLLTVLSVHVYFENKPFIEVMHSEESVVGLIVAAPIGLFMSYWSAGKIRKYQLQQLEFLKDLNRRLCGNGLESH
jgi:ABC-type multidrug transport system fused ATPase/permease subunit